MKNVRSLLLFLSLFSIWTANEAFGCTPAPQELFSARSGGCGLPPYDPDLPFNFPAWKPTQKELPLPDFPKLMPKFIFVDTETEYTVQLRSQNPNPPSCKVVANRLKNLTARLSEMSHLTDKMNKGQKLSYDEIRNYLAMTRKFVPQALDEIDQSLQIQVTWKFLNFLPANEKGIFYFLRNRPQNFDNFEIEGPGLKWVQEGEGIPPFFEIVIDRNVSVTYEMQMLDFCFGDNTLTIRGRFFDEFGPQDPILKATWERDILKGFQRGFWTIKTASQSSAGAQLAGKE